MNKIDTFRDSIDKIDKKIIDLLIERYYNVKEIGEIKKANNLPIYVPEREKQLLDKLEDYANNRLDSKTLKAIYKEIISGAIKLEKKLKIAFLGPIGTFSHQAVMQNFGHAVELLPVNSIAEAIHSVEKNLADYACIPVENSIEGVVNQTLDNLRGSSLQINSEFQLRIQHNLIGSCLKSEIQQVYSHAQILGQCQSYIAKNLPQAVAIETGSSAMAINYATQNQFAAAIGSQLLAGYSNLPVIESNIEDNPNNYTRFINVSRHKNQPTDHDKTSICVALKNQSGALYHALKPLNDYQISMTLIESRPFPATDDYCFFIDFLGSVSDPKISLALAELQNLSSFFKILGSYPSV